VQFGHEARDRLSAAGLDVLYRESPVGHGVDPRGIDELRAWLARTLPARAAA
jgi:predicted esterase